MVRVTRGRQNSQGKEGKPEAGRKEHSGLWRSLGDTLGDAGGGRMAMEDQNSNEDQVEKGGERRPTASRDWPCFIY
jgi:hypothetical protein